MVSEESLHEVRAMAYGPLLICKAITSLPCLVEARRLELPLWETSLQFLLLPARSWNTLFAKFVCVLETA